LEISAGTLSNSLFSESLLVASLQVQKGQPLSQSLAAYPKLFLPIVTQMIQVGEETGTLGEITERLADFYEEEVANVTKGLSTIIEPILMVIIGAAVGFFAISMIQPMYSMVEAI
jgi:type IV pilus assembly protein PilC